MTVRTSRLSPGGALAVFAAVLVMLVGAGPAVAGTFMVNADPAAGTGCDLVSPNGGLNQFYYGCDGFAGSNVGFGYFSGEAALPAGSRIGYQMTAPAGISIYAVQVDVNDISNINDGGGWGGGGYWAGGGDSWSGGASSRTDGPFNSPYWGFQMICGASSCSQSGAISVNTVQLVAVESQGPSLTAVGAGNLWYQTGRYVWNPAGDPWPITLQATDPSGVCSMAAIVDNGELPGPSATPNTDAWQQCPDPTWAPAAGASVDTRDYVPGAGQLSLTLEASNAAGVSSQPSETLEVDNEPVGVTLSTPNDANPSVWVNHAVTVDAATSAGPSGIGGMNCSVDGGKAATYPSAGVSVNGSGVHPVSCTAWNNAVDPQGSPNTGTASTTIHIDETPPSLAFEPQDPSDPTQLVVDTSDSLSGVSGGSIAMAPAGTQTWTSLPTTFDGKHLLASIDDSGLSGPYVFQATSCDNAGNCGTTSQTLTLPVRLPDRADVSFAKIDSPAKVVQERVLVGWHWRRERRHGRLRRVRVGGHYRTVRVLIRENATCATRRVKTGRHRWRELQACRTPHLRLVTHRQVRYGRSVTVHGLVISSQGAPLADAPVQISTAPTNGLNQFAPVTTATTSNDGEWTATLPAGPSRIIKAVYDGSATTLPVAGEVTVTVPAKIGLSITPRTVRGATTSTSPDTSTAGTSPPTGSRCGCWSATPTPPRPATWSRFAPTAAASSGSCGPTTPGEGLSPSRSGWRRPRPKLITRSRPGAAGTSRSRSVGRRRGDDDDRDTTSDDKRCEFERS